MDSAGFDRLTRSFSHALSRRRLATALGLAATGTFHIAGAKNKKKKRKKLKKNEYGCVNVGGKCQGKDGVCCSGICEGKKPKKGKKDKSRCVGHDEGIGCEAGDMATFCGGTTKGCTTSVGDGGICATTTGNGPYCFAHSVCSPCQKDADCVPVCGPQAACAKCGTFCAETGGTLCVGPVAGTCVP